MARITVIDDDIEMADNTASLIRKYGHEVFTLYTIDGAIKRLVHNKPDIVILDVMFPDNPVAGFDLARQIRVTREIKDLPIILLTSINQEFPMGFSAGDSDPEWMPVQSFMEKPVKIPALMEKVSRLLKQKKL